MLHAVIMAGGAGTRFWPLSRTLRPKQLLDLAGDRTMIQMTVDRLAGLVDPARMLIVTNRNLVEPISAQLPELPRERVLGEPCKRDTAPCIGLAALLIAAEDPDAVMAVLPADHLIEPASALRTALRQAAKLVEDDPERLVTFGIRPTYAAESFGYIERGPQLQPTATSTEPLSSVFAVKRFREKPARAIAEEYLTSGEFFWNSGLFVWKAKTILAALARYEPEMFSHLAQIGSASGKPEFSRVLDEQFSALRGKSIDFAVMERHPKTLVIEAPFTWDDVGGWQALARTRGVDQNGNTLLGRQVAVRTRGSIIRSEGDHLIATLGLTDCIVVHTPSATLVASKHEEEAIREIVKELETRGWSEYL